MKKIIFKKLKKKLILSSATIRVMGIDDIAQVCGAGVPTYPGANEPVCRPQ